MSTTRPVALVTGASTGIGRAFALRLADRGNDLVLVARDTARLEALAKELGDSYGASAEVLTADLSDPVALARVETRVADAARPIELLVNNAGYGTAGKFHELPIEGEVGEIELNVVALVRLTHSALAPMVERGSGGVINVASIGGFQPTPHNATYCATKAFVISFSEAIHEELKGSGVNCMVLSPGFTRTNFQERAGIDSSEVPGFLWQEAGDVAEHALRAYGRGRASCVPGALNSATAMMSGMSPTVFSRKLAGAVVRRSEKTP
jgi:short-subunit dehydrogenase